MFYRLPTIANDHILAHPWWGSGLCPCRQKTSTIRVRAVSRLMLIFLFVPSETDYENWKFNETRL
jgi:hypothetical protein